MSILNHTSCRFCQGRLKRVLSLGRIPPVNFFPAISNDSLTPKHPLQLTVCTNCELLQLNTFVYPNELFQNYHYQTGASNSLVSNLKTLADQTIDDLRLTIDTKVLDIGSNDGTFLENFKEKGIEVLGIDPGIEVNRLASQKGIPTRARFFNLRSARELKRQKYQFDLISSLHNLANIPDLNDFLNGIKLLLKPSGTFLIEVADSDKMIKLGQFDNIYHEHYNYFTFQTLERILNYHGFEVKKVIHNQKQGGAITLFAGLNSQIQPVLPKIKLDFSVYKQFGQKVNNRVREIKQTFKQLKSQKLAGFGAPAKAVVVANLCNLSSKQISYIVDSTTFKQGKFLPGTDIPIYSEEQLKKTPVDTVWLFAWNYQQEILKKLRRLKVKQVVIPFPELKIVIPYND